MREACRWVGGFEVYNISGNFSGSEYLIPNPLISRPAAAAS